MYIRSYGVLLSNPQSKDAMRGSKWYASVNECAHLTIAEITMAIFGFSIAGGMLISLLISTAMGGIIGWAIWAVIFTASITVGWRGLRGSRGKRALRRALRRGQTIFLHNAVVAAWRELTGDDGQALSEGSIQRALGPHLAEVKELQPLLDFYDHPDTSKEKQAAVKQKVKERLFPLAEKELLLRQQRQAEATELERRRVQNREDQVRLHEAGLDKMLEVF